MTQARVQAPARLDSTAAQRQQQRHPAAAPMPSPPSAMATAQPPPLQQQQEQHGKQQHDQHDQQQRRRRPRPRRLPAALLLLTALLALALAPRCSLAKVQTLELTIPPAAEVTEQDAYLCTTLRLPDRPSKLVGVEPLARQEVVHHILLFGCDAPYREPPPQGQGAGGKAEEEQVWWDCKSAPTCSGNAETIMYGWGKNAPTLALPDGVGFSVGPGSAIRWVIAQVHYLNERPPGDKSGVRLKLQDAAVPYAAGMLSYASWFSIPPRRKSYLVQNSCCYRGFQPLTTFAVRVHTHALGRSVFMTRLPPAAAAAGEGGGAAKAEDKKAKAKADVIALGDPQLPQGFAPTERRVVWPGERLDVVCDFDSSNVTRTVEAGPGHDNEMCNMYLMVYSGLPHIDMCSDGSSLVDDRSPGNMHPGAAFVRDPLPLWRPPTEEDQALPKGGLRQAVAKSLGAAAKGMTREQLAVLGSVTSVALGADGTLWALFRGGRLWTPQSFDLDNRLNASMGLMAPIKADVVVQMHPDTGKVLRAWGSGVFHMPHMITVDRDNHVWVTDAGRHQALKFTASGELLMEVGRKFEPSHARDGLCKPTQVWPLNDGGFIVSDGYCNSRAVRYDAAGGVVQLYALDGQDGIAGMFVAHSVLADECERVVYVADRQNGLLHRFDMDTGAVQRSGPLVVTADSTRLRVWSLVAGPYGRVLALVWEDKQQALLVDVDRPDEARWPLPDSRALWPHDVALGPAPLALSGAGDRLLAAYVAPLCLNETCQRLQKYVLFPGDARLLPNATTAPPPQVATGAARAPVLAHLHINGHGHGGGAAAAKAGAAKAGAPAAAASPAAAAAAAAAQQDLEQQEQQEEQVEQEAADEDAEEARELGEPAVKQALQAGLAAVKQQLQQQKQPGGGGGGKSPAAEAGKQQLEGGVAAAAAPEESEDAYERVTAPPSAARPRPWWGSLQAVIVSSVVGAVLGVVAVQMLRARSGAGAGAGAASAAAPSGRNGARHSRLPTRPPTIDEMLAEDDDDDGDDALLAAAAKAHGGGGGGGNGERGRLLSLGNGRHGNGHSAGGGGATKKPGGGGNGTFDIEQR